MYTILDILYISHFLYNILIYKASESLINMISNPVINFEKNYRYSIINKFLLYLTLFLRHYTVFYWRKRSLNSQKVNCFDLDSRKHRISFSSPQYYTNASKHFVKGQI